MNFSDSELRSAQKYPFLKAARAVLADSNLSLDRIPESVLRRASAMVSAAFSGSAYKPQIKSSSALLIDEILAFPTAKIIVSLINRLELYRLFTRMHSDSIFRSLEAEQDAALFDIASELGMKYDLPEAGGFFASVSIKDYLRPDLEDVNTKLVNQKVEAGMVYLSRTEFARLISIIAGQELRDTLPVDAKGATQELKSLAKSLDSEFSQRVRKQFSKSDFGEVAPEAFPPCMAKIYSELMSGLNVGHSGRFAIATFLASVGMPPEKIVDAFRRTPNFSEKTTRYQVERIAGKRGQAYSAPSCDKMRSYNLCVANCPVSHPVQFYGRELMRGSGGQKPAAPGEAKA